MGKVSAFYFRVSLGSGIISRMLSSKEEGSNLGQITKVDLVGSSPILTLVLCVPLAWKASSADILIRVQTDFDAHVILREL